MNDFIIPDYTLDNNSLIDDEIKNMIFNSMMLSNIPIPSINKINKYTIFNNYTNGLGNYFVLQEFGDCFYGFLIPKKHINYITNVHLWLGGFDFTIPLEEIELSQKISDKFGSDYVIIHFALIPLLHANINFRHDIIIRFETTNNYKIEIIYQINGYYDIFPKSDCEYSPTYTNDYECIFPSSNFILCNKHGLFGSLNIKDLFVNHGEVDKYKNLYIDNYKSYLEKLYKIFPFKIDYE
jgi:hypothetical protein